MFCAVVRIIVQGLVTVKDLFHNKWLPVDLAVICM